MAPRVSILIALCGVFGGCETPADTLRIIPPDAAFDASIADAAVDFAGLDAAIQPSLTVDTTPIAACAAATIAVEIQTTAAVVVTPIIDGMPGRPAELAPGADLIISVSSLAEGTHTTAFVVDGERFSGPEVVIDRTPPQVTWPVEADRCVVTAPAPIVNDFSAFEVEIEDGILGCRTARRARVVDACGFATTSRSVWRTGPPSAPDVHGDRSFTWTPGGPCTTEITAQFGRVGETPVPYLAGQIIEWPGDYELVLTANGCNGPALHTVPFQIAAGPCDRPTRPLNSAPNVRGWLEITSQRLIDLSLEMAGRGAPEVANPLREAATLLARHPAFPNGCPARQDCLIDADWQRVLAALARATAALAEVDDTRVAQRCVIEAARVVVAAGEYAPAACLAPEPGRALVESWLDPDARAQTQCRCRGECVGALACADAEILQADADPIEFARRIEALGGAGTLECLDDPRCAALPRLIERTRGALDDGDCVARSLLSVAALIIGRHCAGVGQFRHPGTDALAAAVGRWPLGWAGALTTRAHLDRAIEVCLPPQ